MKRSEMVQLIWDYVQSVECDYDCYMDQDNCDELLRKMELAGIRPPKIKNPLVKQEDIYSWAQERALDDLYDRKPKVPEKYHVNAWEQEDG